MLKDSQDGGVGKRDNMLRSLNFAPLICAKSACDLRRLVSSFFRASMADDEDTSAPAHVPEVNALPLYEGDSGAVTTTGDLCTKISNALTLWNVDS